MSGFFCLMKKIFLFFLCILTTFGYAQEMSDGNKKLLEAFNLREEKKNERVKAYLKINSTEKKRFSKDGKTFEIFDIKNGKPLYIATDNINSAKGTKTTHLYNGGSLGLSLAGNGYTVGVWDSGIVEVSHQEFLTDNEAKLVVENTLEVTNHATHVSGTIAAQGANSAAKGMAYDANIKSYDWTNDGSEMVTAANDSENPIYFSNHSYGFPIFSDDNDEQNVSSENIGAYTSSARDWDNIAFQNRKLLIVGSAGNDGTTTYEGGMLPNYDKLTGTNTAKNNLVVANANPSFNPLTQELTGFPINSGSSKGPTDDLRIKPDISGDGTNVFSSITNNDYDNYSGTSMAAPNVCGSLVLVHEHYVNITNELPNAETIKAIACHTAQDDSETIGPDPIYGWGLLNAKAAAELISATATGGAHIKESSINQGDEFSMPVVIESSTRLSVSLCWADPPGPVFNPSLNNPAPVLMNDLDLRVTKDGETYYPWKLKLNENSITNEKGDNSVDNFEKIDIETPTPGTYTISVSHKNNLTNPNQSPLQLPKYQEFSLIVSGINNSLSTNNSNYDVFKIYPNPIKDGVLSVQGVNEVSQAAIKNIRGQIVWDGILSTAIDISHLNSGMYFLTVKGKTDKTVKFILVK